MKKISLLIIGILILSLFFYFKSSPSLVVDQAMPVVTSDEKEIMVNETVAMELGGKYEVYTPDKFSAAVESRRVIYFYANWCPTCQPANEDFQKNMSRLPKDVVVFKANYNDTDTDQVEKDLAKKYGVTYQHTFVQVNRNGEVVSSWNGGQIDELLANIK